MNTELFFEQRILELEKKLLHNIEALNECKKENEAFIHIASHDLQAPLRKLATFIERLAHKSHETLGEEALLYIEKINGTVTDMRSLIDGLSALSDITEAHIDFITCDLNDIMKAAIIDLKLVQKEKRVPISNESLPTIQANPSQIKKVFINLLSNSIKFQSKDATAKVNITFGVLNTEEKAIFDLHLHKVYYKIEFADNGIGFNQQYADKIFKPFQRLHGTSAYKGNGLGLAICKKIIENHNGIIYAKGNENKGALFVLILPETQNT